MHTTKERLDKYCEEHNVQKPYGRHRDELSFTIIETLKAQDKYGSVTKITVTEEMEVNAYPDDVVPVIDQIIAEYYCDRAAFWTRNNSRKTGKPKKVTYDVQDYKAAAFEKALVRCGLPVEQNKGLNNKNGVVQFIIPVVSLAGLITLGKFFQKERDWEKRQRYREAKAKAVTDEVLGEGPEQKAEIPKKRKRLPIPKDPEK